MEIVAKEGPSAIKKGPYVAWYLNSMQFRDSPTWKHHVETYGENFSYDDFKKPFEEASAKMDLDAWAEFFQEAGARYVVFITKHHDGYLLWPSNYHHPFKKDHQSKRDFVGELTKAVRRKNMRMGLYYSGVFDWSFTHTPIASAFSFLMNMRQGRQYIEYANNHIRELIDHYKPSILWNDIGYPAGTDVKELIAYYYNTVEDGLINDRWNQIKVPNNPIALAFMRANLKLMEKKMRKQDQTMIEPRCHYDFRTPEYTSFKEIRTEKWETVRGIGKAFAYNQIEDEKIVLSSRELIRYFADVVSKNGNLLVGIGPKADGTFSELHQKPLLELGAWLKVNGEAIFDTRPWKRAEGKIEEGTDVRFTMKAESLYATILDTPRGKEISLKNLKAADNTGVFLLGREPIKYFAWTVPQPRARVTGKLILAGEEIPVNGVGYHDHNWGNVPLREIYDHWYWGGLFLPNHTFLYSVGQASESLGHVAMAILVAFKGVKLVKMSTHIDAEPSDFEVDELTGVKYPRKLVLKIEASNIKGEVTHRLRRLADSFMFPQARKGHGFLRFLSDCDVRLDMDGERIEVETQVIHELMIP